MELKLCQDLSDNVTFPFPYRFKLYSPSSYKLLNGTRIILTLYLRFFLKKINTTLTNDSSLFKGGPLFRISEFDESENFVQILNKESKNPEEWRGNGRWLFNEGKPTEKDPRKP